jgi:RHS repeat-associated protein
MKNWTESWTHAIAAALLLAAGMTTSCETRDVPQEQVSRSARAFLGVTGAGIDRVLGMEAPTTDWSIRYGQPGTLAASTTASQGTLSLSLQPRGWVPIRSVPLSSLGSAAGTSFQVDLRFQGTQTNQWWWGTLTIGVDIPSLGVQASQNGLIVDSFDLTNKLAGGWNTLSFDVPVALQTALAGNYSDLQFTIIVNVPSDTMGTYLIDNLHFVAQSVPPTGTDTSTGTSTNTVTATDTATTTATNTATITSTATSTGTITDTVTTTGTSTVTATSTGTGTSADAGTGVGGSACLSNWESTTCGQWCVNQPQEDWRNCQAFLDCYREHNCGPDTCGKNPTDVCHPNNVSPHLGSAGQDKAAVVWQCLSCPGSTPVESCTGIPDTAPCASTTPCDKGDICMAGQCACSEPTQAADPTAGMSAFPGTLNGELSVSPTGAAMYKVPISLPPGIAGMVPNLALVYSSQGGNGIAGQGWDLTGLSIVHLCPKTRSEDGLAQPVTLSDVIIGDGGDGICLDGKRLFDRGAKADGTGRLFELELTDFSEITLSSDGSMFTVVTKSGETRYYGMDDTGRVRVPGFFGSNPPADGKTTAIWLLQKVVDVWGNYYDIQYNYGGKGFDTSGIIVTQIAYTGRLAGSASDDKAGAVPTFQSIKFVYEDRSDVRIGRFRSTTLPRNQRLTRIITDIGFYKLDYFQPAATPTVDDKMLPSRLQQIEYIPFTGDPVRPLTFDWDAGGYDWVERPDFKLPDTVTPGTWFMDLDGDGRLDMVSSQYGSNSTAWRNTGTKFEKQQQSWSLPSDIWQVDGDKSPGNTTFADLDGDGLLDGMHINARECVGNKCFPDSATIWLNRIRTDGNWLKIGSLQSLAGWIEFTHFDQGHGALVDMDGDGLPDLVSMAEGANEPMRVLINKGFDYAAGKTNMWEDATAKFGGITPIYDYELRDVNRDGLPDLVGRSHTQASGKTYVNTGKILPGHTTVWVSSDIGLPADIPRWMESTADFDGDGLYDVFQFGCLALLQGTWPPGLRWQDLLACPDNVPWDVPIPSTETIAVSTGVGYAPLPPSDPRMAVLKGFVPPANDTILKMENYAFVAVDINGDGLSDLVQRGVGSNGNLTTLGRVLFNTGGTFIALDGATSYKDPIATDATPSIPKPVPRIPQGGRLYGDSNTTFIDLDGDGVTDLANNVSAWRNTFQPPRIVGFPNGLAKKTVPTYQVITTAEAQNNPARPGHPTYEKEAAPTLASGTSFMLTPLRVVASIAADDGIGGTAVTDYEYRKLRASPSGRGPQGFGTIIVTGPEDKSLPIDHRTRIETETDYLQPFPYTGLPWKVTRQLVDSSSGNALAQISVTMTGYCDAIPGSNQSCTPQDVGADPSANGTLTTRFVRPTGIVDTSFLLSSAALSGGGGGAAPWVQVETTFEYDSQGNPLNITVTTAKVDESYQKRTVNVYGAAGSAEERLGKVTLSSVTTEKLFPQDCLAATPITHVTQFEYGDVSQFKSPVGEGDMVKTLGLRKTIVEPGAEAPIKLHIAYDYDRFGNVIKTTSCASEFESCGKAGETGPSYLPYRITTVSYDPADFSIPPGTGHYSKPPYEGAGRFPVKTTNAAGHTEMTAYDARFGTLVQQTGPNGISTCKEFDGLGRQTSEIGRCGSTGELVTKIQRFSPSDWQNGPIKVVTVTTPPAGSPTWMYTDALGRARMTLARAFDSQYVKTLTLYDSLGRTFVTTQPYLSASPDLVLGSESRDTVTRYDSLGRVMSVAQDLGVLDGTATSPPGSQPQSTTITTTYEGSTVTTTRTVNGETRTRSETKNALGKISSVTDANKVTVAFSYDADGNLRYTAAPSDACDTTTGAANNAVQITYDARGRKETSHDPDLGDWGYQYNGFGDLVLQADGKGRPTVMTYDTLGRVVQREDDKGTALWIYDAAPHGIGKLAAMVSPSDPRLAGTCDIEFAPTPANGEKSAGKSYHYTPFGDVEQVTDCADGSSFLTTYGYDQFGRPNLLRYPQAKDKRFAVNYTYTKAGYLHYVADDATGAMMWAATAMNAAGQVTDEVLGNGVETASVRNDATGWLLGRTSTAHADGDNLVQKWAYAFDEAGNLRARQRADSTNAVAASETFGYDSLDRLLSADVKTPAQGYSPESYTYDDLGNLQTKAGKSYKYGTGCQAGFRDAGPHAVCQIDDGPTYNYDGNGNLLSVGDRTVEWNPANKATRLTSGTADGMKTADFIYGADGQRVVEAVGVGDGALGSSSNETLSRTVYVGLGATGKSVYERTTRGTTVQHSHFVYAGAAHGGSAFAIRVLTEDGSASSTTPKTEYHHFDHLGSVTASTDDHGHVTSAVWSGPSGSVIGYDPWGAIRSSDGHTADPATYASPAGNRGFTDQEAIPNLGLVNMNGRIYDPTVGRFLSPDPNVQFASDLQSYNRYSYAADNPLRYTDPTGYYQRQLSGGERFWQNYGGFVNMFGTGAVFAVCWISSGTACYAASLALTAINTTAAIQSGTPWLDAVLMNGSSFIVGAGVAGGVAKLGLGVVTSAAITGGIMAAYSTALYGGNLGENVLEGIAVSAALAAVSAAASQTNPVDQASAAQQGGGNYGDVRHEITDEPDGTGRVHGRAAAETNVNARVKFQAEWDSSGHLVDASADVDFDIKTTYRKGVDPSAPSAYGRGTTGEDVAAGDTSLGFHEHNHAVDYRAYIESHDLPEFNADEGMTRGQYRAAQNQFRSDLNSYVRDMQSYSRQVTDCVGTPAGFCH